MSKLDERLRDAADWKDSYLEGLQATLDVCNMVINNHFAFPADQVKKAEKLKGETLKNIQKREGILLDRRV